MALKLCKLRGVLRDARLGMQSLILGEFLAQFFQMTLQRFSPRLTLERVHRLPVNHPTTHIGKRCFEGYYTLERNEILMLILNLGSSSVNVCQVVACSGSRAVVSR